jgi:peptidase M28-like protein
MWVRLPPRALSLAGVDARHEIEELVAFEGRWAGTDAERRAARHLERRLEELGRDARVEPTSVRPSYPIAHAVHAVLAIVGSVVAVDHPAIGAGLVLVALLLTFGDATGMFMLTRRLTGWRASQNVVSPEEGDKPATLILVAHYDAARTGAIFGRRVQERRAALGRLLHRPIGPLDPFFWSIAAILVCCLIRLPGLDNVALTAVQFVPTVALIVSVPLLVDVALSGVVPGANDNASGVATVLRLGDRYGGALEHFDLWLVLTGAEEPFALGMRAFLKRHRHSLDKARTVVVNVEEVGFGTVRYTEREGPVISIRSHVQLVEICDQISEDDEDGEYFGARRLVSRTKSDGFAARLAGYPAITVCCRNALDYTPEHHLPTDTPERIDDDALERAFGFCSELVQRLDAQVGADIAKAGEHSVLAEEDEG